MNGTTHEHGVRRHLAIEMMVLGVVILVLAVLGPFGTYQMPFGLRLATWALFLLGGYACFRPVIAAGGALARQSGLPRGLAIAVACLFGALPTTLIVAGVFAGWRWREIGLGDLAALYPQVLIVGATVTAVQLLARQTAAGESSAPPPGPPAMSAPSIATPGGKDSATPGATAEAPRSPFLDLLPPHLDHELLCVENEDHYVRAHTAQGNALILMRMRDAVAQLAGEEGERVHRGWWVARRAVVAVVRRERSLLLRLCDGREVPVARANVAQLRAKGWLDGMPKQPDKQANDTPG